MSWWTRVWWQAPLLWSVLSKHLIPRSGNQPEELVCTSLLRSFLPAGPLKQPRQRYNKHSTTFQLLLSPFPNRKFPFLSAVKPFHLVRSDNVSQSRACCTWIDWASMRTCQVCVMWRVDEVVRQGEIHIFRLVQLLWRDDSIFITGQITGETLKGDDTCT